MKRFLIPLLCAPAFAATAQVAAVSDYEANYPGEYSQSGQCGEEGSVTLTADSFRIGETVCTIADIEGHDLDGQPMIRLNGSNCQAESEPADDFALDVGQTGYDTEIRVMTEGFETLMVRCEG